MRVLVTGGAGYIGSHAARLLAEGGTEVVILDSFVKGHRGAVTINITGIGEVTASAVIDATPEPEDVEVDEETDADTKRHVANTKDAT